MAVPCLAAALPVLGGAAALIRLTTGEAPLFRQERLGRDGRPFQIHKLRTMRGAAQQVAPEDGKTDPRDPRITPIGHVLRRSALDELPQLWDVVRGEMSLVGPRPTVPEQGPAFGDAQATRLRVRPGLTGWSQIHGNTRLGWQKRADLDRWYVEHASLWLDLQILARTPLAILRGKTS